MTDGHPRWSFRKRMWMLLGASVAMCLALMAPMYMHDWLMHGRVNALKREFEEALRHRESVNEAEQWLTQHGFRIVAKRLNRPPDERSWNLIVAQRHLTNGSPFWHPASAHVSVEFGFGGEMLHGDWIVWPFTTPQGGGGSRWDRIVPQTAPILPIAVILTIIVLTVRRDMRRQRGQCVECGYPIGTSDVCTECGRPIERVG